MKIVTLAIAFCMSFGSIAFAQQAVTIQNGSSPVSTTNPLPTLDGSNLPFSTAVAMTVGTTYTAGRSVGFICTVSGNVSLQLSGGSTYVVPAGIGFQTLPFAVTAINTSGTTATCTYAELN